MRLKTRNCYALRLFYHGIQDCQVKSKLKGRPNYSPPVAFAPASNSIKVKKFTAFLIHIFTIFCINPPRYVILRALTGVSEYFMSYIRRMQDLREDSDYTQEYVAHYLGTSQTMYARFLNLSNFQTSVKMFC